MSQTEQAGTERVLQGKEYFQVSFSVLNYNIIWLLILGRLWVHHSKPEDMTSRPKRRRSFCENFMTYIILAFFFKFIFAGIIILL
jgi:hypothetical protein